VTVNSNLSLTVTGSNPAVPVTAVNAVITFTYAPVAPTSVSLSLVDVNGTAVSGNFVTIQASAPVSLGQLTVTVPINILNNPGLTPAGAPVVDTVGLNVSLPGLLYTLPYGGKQPTLVITGSPSQIIFSPILSPFKPTPPVNLT
jgi:hypothetical protein